MAFITIKQNTLNNYGIGLKKYNLICNLIGLNTRMHKAYVNNKINEKKKFLINKYTFNSTLKFKIKEIIEQYKNLKNYRGIRHFLHYPVRGQRTHTNAKTVRRKKKKLIKQKLLTEKNKIILKKLTI